MAIHTIKYRYTDVRLYQNSVFIYDGGINKLPEPGAIDRCHWKLAHYDVGDLSMYY